MAKPEQEQRRIRISVRLTRKERDFLAGEADISGLSLSSFIRKRALGRRISSKADLRVLAELRRLGGLLKHLHNETGAIYSDLTAGCLREIVAYIHDLNENRRGEFRP